MLVGGSRAAWRVVRSGMELSSMQLSSNTRQFEEPAHSEIYARFRPVAPSSIVEHILTFRGEEARRGEGSLALDVGCGSGAKPWCLSVYITSWTYGIEKVL